MVVVLHSVRCLSPPKAKEFARSGLFAGVKSFADLETRFSAIPESNGKGDAFEVLGIGSYFRSSSVASAPLSWAIWSKEIFLNSFTEASFGISIFEKLIALMGRM